MTDYLSYSSLAPDSDLASLPYRSRQWKYISETTRSEPQASNISFSTQQIANQFNLYEKSYLEIPIKIKSSTTTKYTDQTLLAIKTSLLSLIKKYSVSINTSTASESDNIQYYNNWKLLCETSVDYVDSNGQEIMFAPDDSRSKLTGPTQTGALPSGSPAPPVLVGDVGIYTGGGSNTFQNWYITTFNRGLQKRILMMHQGRKDFPAVNPNPAYSEFEFVAYIPLVLIADFFRVFDFPVLGMNINFSFDINYGLNGRFAPVFTDGAKPLIELGTGCKLWYEEITFSAEQMTEVSGLLASGIRKELKFLEMRTLEKPNSQAGNVEIDTSAVMPVKILACAIPQGHINAHDELALPTLGFQTSQITINNVNYFPNTIQGDLQHYEQLKRVFPELDDAQYRSLLNFYLWKNVHHIHAYDVSRYQDRSFNPTQSATISLEYSLQNSAPHDLITVVVKETTLLMEMGKGNITIQKLNK